MTSGNITNEPIIIYEDNDVLVVNKPAGLMVHPDGKTQTYTLSQWFADSYPESRGVGEPLKLKNGTIIDRPGIVHRIDRETSGVLVVAKTQQAHSILKKQFQNREMKKEYKIFVYGSIKEDNGTIDRPIGRSSKDFRLWSAQRGARGELRDAITHFEVLKRSSDVSYANVRPETGRTHQIRVHFKAVNHPVVCDKLYAPKRECILGFTRLALHAHSITLTLPSGTKAVFEAPLPEDFKRALECFDSSE